MESTDSPAYASWLAWKDLWVTLTDDRKQQHQILLHGVTGYAEPGHILAIMGPSGSGKSTLLDALAGRLGGHAKLKGDIFLNGQKRNQSLGKIAYVTQEDTLLGTLTVRETLLYTANLRLRPCLSWEEKASLVQKTILEMGLQDSADTPVGNWHIRGLSGGEKRRLSIALEILTRPHLLFLDEPTSGLDSASALFVMATLRKLARDGRTVIASIHQPSCEVFALFDSLFLLSSGRTVYFGECALASEHFSNAGFPCPSFRNPSDHYLSIINSDFDRVKTSLLPLDLEASNLSMQMSSTQMTDILVGSYSKSKFAVRARSKVDDLSQRFQREVPASPAESYRRNAGFWMETCTLTRRSFVNMRRDVGYYWLRLAIYVMLTTCIGSIYFHVGTDYQSVMARAACMSYVTGFLTFMSIGGFPSFVEDMKVFNRERLNGHYGVLPFVVGNFLSALPFLMLISFVSGAICYYMVQLHPGLDHFLYFVLCLLACVTVVESLMMAVASLVPNFLMGIITGAGIQGIFMLVAGFFRLPGDLPKPLWRYPMSYLSFHMYALQGMYQNDFIGLEFKAGQLWAPSIQGRFILEKMFEIDLGRSKWWDVSVLVAMTVGYRLVFLAMIKVCEHQRGQRQPQVVMMGLLGSLVRNVVATSKRYCLRHQRLLFTNSSLNALPPPLIMCADKQ